MELDNAVKNGKQNDTALPNPEAEGNPLWWLSSPPPRSCSLVGHRAHPLPTVTSKNVLLSLTDSGYTGHLSSEYEGDRIAWRSIEQLRRRRSFMSTTVAAL